MAGSPGITKQIGSFKFTVTTVSKWLDESEKSVFCNVTETGDILEVEHKDSHHWGISIRTTASRNKGADGIQVVSYRPDQGKVVQEKLEKFWVPDSRIRINNKSDQNMPYHSEEEIRQQVTYALRHQKKQKWHNSEHFAHWCRHGKKVGNEQERNVSDMAKWGSISASAGAWMFMKTRRQRHNTQ
ncbi:uncharacterized protein LOC110830013 [Zootermopsis nevadensis]|uniref:uncharacterized protein LOC110830013 n=1 Tax=Zootermopsis nevadensis TaxID=136037 RepID=UPI000B8E35D8|nr:uncharacterized protein LOC110830013 [Zootermopsis nevadensis]